MGEVIKKIKLFALFLFCFFFYLIRGRADKKPKEFKKFLIVQMAKMGDMVCATPLFKAIKDKNQNNQVFVLSNVTNINLLANHPYIDGFFVYERKKFWSVIKKIKKQNFDFGCITAPNFLGLAILYLSKIPFIVAPAVIEENLYDRSYYKILRKLATISVNYQMHQYMPLQYLKLLEPVEIYSQNVKKVLGFSRKAQERVSSFLISKNIDVKKDVIVAIHVGVGNKLKLWEMKKWAQLIDILQEKYKVKVIITGSQKDEKEVKEVLELSKTRPLWVLDFNLDESKALINSIDIFISCDSGPIYIAEAFGKYTIDITGPSDEKEQPPSPPYYEKGYLVYKKDLFCRPCSFVMNTAKTCRYKNRYCLMQISVDDILTIFDQIFPYAKK